VEDFQSNYFFPEEMEHVSQCSDYFKTLDEVDIEPPLRSLGYLLSATPPDPLTYIDSSPSTSSFSDVQRVLHGGSSSSSWRARQPGSRSKGSLSSQQKFHPIRSGRMSYKAFLEKHSQDVERDRVQSIIADALLDIQTTNQNRNHQKVLDGFRANDGEPIELANIISPQVPVLPFNVNTKNRNSLRTRPGRSLLYH
jgi:hypothetical protein